MDIGSLISSGRRRGDQNRKLDRNKDIKLQNMRNSGASAIARINQSGATQRNNTSEMGANFRQVVGLTANKLNNDAVIGARGNELSEKVRQFDQGRKDKMISSYMAPKSDSTGIGTTAGLTREQAENKYSLGQKLQGASSPSQRSDIVNNETRRVTDIKMRDMTPEQRYGIMTASDANKRAYSEDISAYDRNKSAVSPVKKKTGLFGKIFGGK